jgi:hypothetical protein
MGWLLSRMTGNALDPCLPPRVENKRVLVPRPQGSRNRAILNKEFMAALLRHFRREGKRAIARMARTPTRISLGYGLHSPLLARLGRTDRLQKGPFIGVKRTCAPRP